MGPLPRYIQQISALTYLDLSENELSGAIPAELGQLRALFELSLSTNQLSGSIPAELGQLGALTCLYLCINQLTGQEAFQGHTTQTVLCYCEHLVEHLRTRACRSRQWHWWRCASWSERPAATVAHGTDSAPR